MVETCVLIDGCGEGIRWTCPTEVVFEVGVWWVAGLGGGGGDGGGAGSERTC